MALLSIEHVVVEPEHALSRRSLLGGLAGAAAAIAIGRNVYAAQDASLESGRTVETIHGPVVVPTNPKRIVAINFPSAVALLELGVTPVGIPNYLPAFPEGHPTAEGAEVIQTSTGEIDFEMIVRLKPDLILGSDWLDPAKQLAPYEELSAIAPTLLFEWTQAAGNWEVEAAGCAEAIGRTAELDALKNAFETKAATIKSTYSETLSSLSWDLISASNTNWYLYGPTSSHGKVVILAGITLGAAKEQTDGYLELSLEQLNLLENTDVLVTRSFGDETYAELTKLDTFNNLEAVTGQRLLQTDYFFPSSYGLSSALLDDIETGLNSL